MAGTGWEVTSQLTNQIKNTPTGGTVEGAYIYFMTEQGNAGAVFVPSNIYSNKHKVRAIINAQANLIDEIGQMNEPFKT